MAFARANGLSMFSMSDFWGWGAPVMGAGNRGSPYRPQAVCRFYRPAPGQPARWEEGLKIPRRGAGGPGVGPLAAIGHCRSNVNSSGGRLVDHKHQIILVILDQASQPVTDSKKVEASICIRYAPSANIYRHIHGFCRQPFDPEFSVGIGIHGLRVLRIFITHVDHPDALRQRFAILGFYLSGKISLLSSVPRSVSQLLRRNFPGAAGLRRKILREFITP